MWMATPLLITLFGERDPSSLGHAGAGKMLGDVWVFNVKSEAWTMVRSQGDVPAPRGWFAADVAQGRDGKNTVVVHGGLTDDNTRLSDMWRLTFT